MSIRLKSVVGGASGTSSLLWARLEQLMEVWKGAHCRGCNDGDEARLVDSGIARRAWACGRMKLAIMRLVAWLESAFTDRH